MCQEALNHERIRHSETEKNLNCVWNAHTRLGEIISKVPYQVTASGEEKTGDSIDITELVLELEAKASKIQGLEDALIHQQEQSHSDLLLIEGRLHERSVQHQEEVTAKTETINELESQLRRGRLEVDAEDTGPEAKVPKRAGRKWKRTRGKGRACKGVSTEEAVGKQSLSDPLESSGETFVETFKEEVVQ
jgi:hypothetical protein